MAGMLDAAQLDQLAAAGGPDAGKLFLAQMVADQEEEILQMKDLLGRLQ